MKKFIIIVSAASLLTLLVMLAGCGLVSGTVFISQKVDGDIEAESGGLAMRAEGANVLDDQFGGAKVDLRDNSEWQDIDIDGIEDICVRMTVINLRNESVSGEVWVTIGEDSLYANLDSVQAHGGFHIFHGLLVGPNDTLTFSCSETLELFDNLDLLVDAVKEGVFWVWGKGEQNDYHLKYEAIYLGLHVTGSI